MIPPGARVEGDKVVIKEECVEQDSTVPGDERTAKIIQEISNGVCNFIQMETDYPTNHSDGLMPILDLKVNMQDNMIVYRYYRKDMANFKLLMAKSAMPFKMKKTCLIQEVLRILRNTSRRLDNEIKTNFLNEFSYRMMISGYSEKVRLEVIQKGLEAYERQLKRDEENECPLYRPKGYNEEERRKKKLRNKMSWYKPHDTVLFCPPSPNSMLANEMKKIAAEEKTLSGISIKVVERAGHKIRSLLPGMQEEASCRRNDCIVHANGGRGQCSREGAVYKGSCVTCKEEKSKDAVYIGETGRSGYARGKEHLTAIKKPVKYKSNAFAKHILEHHAGNRNVKFKVDIIKCYQKPLERQVREGVEILRMDADIAMNSKIDFIQPGIRRLAFADILEE